MNWMSIIKYTIAIFIAQFFLGFFEGLLFERSVSVALSSSVASFVVCGAIFRHLGKHQLFKPFVHAWAVFVLGVASGWGLILLLYRWFGSPDIIYIVFENIVVILALVAGTSLGIISRKETNPKGKA